MKIILSSAGPFDRYLGGGQVYVQRLACELHRRGHDVTVFAPIPWPGGGEIVSLQRSSYEGVSVIGLCPNPSKVTPAERASEMGAVLAAEVRRLLAELAPDVVHINGWKAVMTTACKELGIPHVVTAHHPGVACPNGTLLTPENEVCRQPMSARACVPCVCRQLRGGCAAGRGLARLPSWLYRPAGALLGRLRNATYAGRVLMYPWLVEQTIRGRKTALQSAQRFIAPSVAIREALVRNGLSEDRAVVIPHGIEPLPKTPIADLSGRPVRFGYVGQINRPKGLEVLFQAFDCLPQDRRSELHIIGAAQHPWEEDFLARLMSRCTSRERVVLHGYVPHDRLGEAVAQIDVLILPSILMEVFGLSVLESLSAGRPVIVSDSCGVAEVIRHNVDGLIVARNSVEALAGAMRELLANPEKILAMAANIRPVRTFSEHLDDVETIYATVIGERAQAATDG